MNYFYHDQTNQKQGPVTEQQLKELAEQGVIGPQTPMETDTGHKGTAGQIPGLFPAASVQVPHSASKQVFCTNCGQPVSDQAVACMSCGSKPIGHRKFCRQCGAGVSPEQVICTKCGAGISGASSKAVASAAAPQQAFCTNCGNPVSAQAVACMSCGAKPTPPQPTTAPGAAQGQRGQGGARQPAPAARPTPGGFPRGN